MLSEGGVIQYTQGPVDILSIVGEYLLGGNKGKAEEDKSDETQ